MNYVIVIYYIISPPQIINFFCYNIFLNLNLEVIKEKTLFNKSYLLVTDFEIILNCLEIIISDLKYCLNKRNIRINII